MNANSTIPHYRFEVLANWCDYNEHFSDCYYLIPFGSALDIVLDTVGLGAAYRKLGHHSTYTVDAHVRYLREAKANDQLTIFSSIRDADAKRLFVHHDMLRGDDMIATCDFICVHVDVTIPKSAPLPQHILANILHLKI